MIEKRNFIICDDLLFFQLYLSNVSLTESNNMIFYSFVLSSLNLSKEMQYRIFEILSKLFSYDMSHRYLYIAKQHRLLFLKLINRRRVTLKSI